MNGMTRRAFLKASLQAGAACVVSYGLVGCGDSSSKANVEFKHGIASGDPLNDRVIIWTRVTPEWDTDVTVAWEVATDSGFTNLVNTDSFTTDADKDYTVKVDVTGLSAGMKYYYRFKVGDTYSETGETITLPEGSVSSLKIALFSCAMWEHGYFQAYADAAAQSPDIALHVGDYIYEYETGDYESPTGSPVRVFEPTHEIVTLDDYRKRYAQYRTDAHLQELHRMVPWIVIWDDHEVANDTYKDGAENHSDDEGDFVERKAAALQAYYEWLPIRIQNADDLSQAYRSFDYGDLVSLHVIESRLLARDESAAGKQNQLALITDETELAAAMTDLATTLADSSRKLIGDTQMGWLQGQMAASTATWQVLGNETIMAQMKVPQSILMFQLDVTDFAAIGALVQTYAAVKAQVPSGTDEATIMAAVDAALPDSITQALVYAGMSETDAAAMVDSKIEMLDSLESETKIAYNLDAWDGYPYEQLTVMASAYQIHQTKAAAGLDSNLVVLTGDSHNSWANNLRYDEVDTSTGSYTGNQYPVGVEFAVTSVSSVGLEKELKDLLVEGGVITEEQYDPTLFAGMFNYYIQDNQYLEMQNRGYALITFTKDEAVSEYRFVQNVLESNDYDASQVFSNTVVVKNGEHVINSIS